MIQTCLISWSLSKDNDYDDVGETSLKKWIDVVSMFIALIQRFECFGVKFYKTDERNQKIVVL